MASAELAAVVQMLRDQPPMGGSATAQERRAQMDATAGALPWPAGVTPERSVVGGIAAVWVRPDSGAVTDAALLYLHGGAYALGSPDTHRGITGRLATLLGCPVLSLDYRLAPEHPHPAAVEDSTAAYRSLVDEGFAPSRLAICGDSAGGGLTIATLLKLRDDGVPLPSCAAPISPWVDMTMSGESMTRLADADPMVKPDELRPAAEWFVGDGDPRDPYASPLFADLSGLPPLLVHVGEVETLLDDSLRLAERARQAGVDVTLEVFPEMIHVFHAFCGMVPEADAACETVAAFLRKHMGL
jgi:acetyl esterase/lipase